jgi:hypothetical protein|tara:strand:- start:586 stop:705 length:120 start_codon:yes stop_codon:yes gene_type:complete
MLSMAYAGLHKELIVNTMMLATAHKGREQAFLVQKIKIL